ncbi:MAG: AMIN domain-containing protein, partial [Moorea sp. SIO3C2]|nr:AMIN domain-containing protein [Moorena sp. SIO3C2]
MVRGAAMLSRNWMQTTLKRFTHRPNIARVSLLSLLGCVLASAALPQHGVYGAQLTRWLFDPTTQWLTLNVPGGTSPQYFLLAQPPRIVVDLPNTQVNNVPEVTTYSGMVQSVRVGQFQPELTRIVIEFDPNITFAPGHITIQPGDKTASSGETTAETWYIRPLLVGQGNDALPPGLVASQPVPAPLPPPTPEARTVESSSSLAPA